MRAFLFGALTFAIVFAGTCFMGVVFRAQPSISPQEGLTPALNDQTVGLRERNAIHGTPWLSHGLEEEQSPVGGCLLGASPFVIRD